MLANAMFYRGGEATTLSCDFTRNYLELALQFLIIFVFFVLIDIVNADIFSFWTQVILYPGYAPEAALRKSEDNRDFL